MPQTQPLKLIIGSANAELGQKLAEQLDIEPTRADISRFADGETHVLIQDDVRTSVVCIVQATCPPVNDHLMELALTVDAARAAGADRIAAVVPYFGYARQERRTREGECRSAQVAAKLLGSVGLDHLITLDLHAPGLESALPMPMTDLHSEEVFAPRIERWGLENIVVVAPDAGGLKRAQRYGDRLDAPLAVAAKERRGKDKAATVAVLGDVRGRDCVLVDDMVSTGGTLVGATEALLAAGAREVSAAFTHPVMSENADKRITEAPLQRLLTSDSVSFSSHERVEVATVAPLLATAVRKMCRE